MDFETLEETCKKYATLEEYKEKVEKAKEIVREVLQREGQKYVAYSGGKDSSCVLHLVVSQAPNTLCLHWDYGRYFIPREIYNEIIWNAAKIGAKNIEVRTSEKYEKYKRKARGVLGQDLLGKVAPELYEKGYRYCFLGLRKEESIRRRRRINADRSYTKIHEVYPIADWTWLDVWTYLITNKLPILNIYKRYGKVIGWDKVRFITLFDSEFDKYGTPNVDGVLYWEFKNIK